MLSTNENAYEEPSTSRPSTGDVLAYLHLTGILGTSDNAAWQEVSRDLEWVTVPAGATLLRQGERADALYVVVYGCLQAVLRRADGSEVVINNIGAGQVVGEIPLLTGGTRTASLYARSPTTLLKCPHTTCRRLCDKAPQVLTALASLARQRLQHNQITNVLCDLFGPLDATVLCDIAGEARPVYLPRGATLCRQGEAGDDLYIVISGRLQVTVTNDNGYEQVVGEIGRGESVGEMAVFTGEQRSASVVASRDSLLLQFPKTGFARLLATYPQVGAYTSRLLSRRLQQARHTAPARRGTTHLALVPASPQVPLAAFTKRLAAALAPFSATVHLSSARVDRALGIAGIAHTPDDHPQAMVLMAWLDEQEARCRFVCYEADPWASPWSKRCMQQADQVLIVGQAAADPQPGVLETTLLSPGNAPMPVRHLLVLLHPDGSQPPTGTHRWLAPRRVTHHYHLRWDSDADVTRLARALAGRAVGLVLSGGGARAYAHIGVMRALQEAGTRSISWEVRASERSSLLSTPWLGMTRPCASKAGPCWPPPWITPCRS